MSTNPAWLTEWCEGKITKGVSFPWCYLIPRGFPIGKGRAGILCSWHQVGCLTVPSLLKHLGTGCWEYPPNAAKLKTSVQNVLRHLYHALTLTAVFLSFDCFLYFHHLNVSGVVLLYFLYRVSLGLEGKQPCSIQRCVGFQVVLGWGWNECLGQGCECVSEERRHPHYFCPAETESRRGKTRMCSGVVLEAGSLCEAGRRGKGGERGTGATAVLTLETEDWETSLNMRKGLWTGGGEPETNSRWQPE